MQLDKSFEVWQRAGTLAGGFGTALKFRSNQSASDVRCGVDGIYHADQYRHFDRHISGVECTVN